MGKIAEEEMKRLSDPADDGVCCEIVSPSNIRSYTHIDTDWHAANSGQRKKQEASVLNTNTQTNKL